MFKKKNLENENFIAVAVVLKMSSENLTTHKAALWVSKPIADWFSNISYLETIHAQENSSRGTHFAKFLISNFL